MKTIKIVILALTTTFTSFSAYAGCDIFQTKRIYMQDKSKDNRQDLADCIESEHRKDGLSEEELKVVIKRFLATPGIKNDREAKGALYDIVQKIKKERNNNG